MAHPHMDYDPNGPIKQLREICLALPGTTEKEAWGECTFRAGGKMFAMTDNNHHESGHVAVWVKSPAMVQEILVHSDPKRFFVPPYVGHNGWVGVRLDVKVDWEQLAGILADGHKMTAQKPRSATPRASRPRPAPRPRNRRDRT
jgi:predicted DNA-binding protein (MmcQ/YjbR family)